MKKLFTLIAMSLLTVGAFAADRQPIVTINRQPIVQLFVTSGVEVVVDGRSYFSNTVAALGYGRVHKIQVFERGYQGYSSSARGGRLLGTASFQANEDLYISTNDGGGIVIETTREFQARANGYVDNRYDNRNSGYDNRNSDYGWKNGSRSRDRRTNDWGRNDNSNYDRNRRF